MQLRENDRVFQKNQREIQVANYAVIETQQLSLRKTEEARSCRQQLEGVKTQLDSAREKVRSVKVESSEAAIQYKGDMARLQKD